MTSNSAKRRQRIKEQSKEVANYLNKQPSDELIQQWMDEFYGGTGALASTEETFMAKRAAEWGADQELEACIKLLADLGGDGEMIRRYRRPRTLSLKEQALKELKDWTDEKHGPGGEVFLCEGLSVALIREALESLPE